MLGEGVEGGAGECSSNTCKNCRYCVAQSTAARFTYAAPLSWLLPPGLNFYSEKESLMPLQQNSFLFCSKWYSVFLHGTPNTVGLGWRTSTCFSKCRSSWGCWEAGHKCLWSPVNFYKKSADFGNRAFSIKCKWTGLHMSQLPPDLGQLPFPGSAWPPGAMISVTGRHMLRYAVWHRVCHFSVLLSHRIPWPLPPTWCAWHGPQAAALSTAAPTGGFRLGAPPLPARGSDLGG